MKTVAAPQSLTCSYLRHQNTPFRPLANKLAGPRALTSGCRHRQMAELAPGTIRGIRDNNVVSHGSWVRGLCNYREAVGDGVVARQRL